MQTFVDGATVVDQVRSIIKALGVPEIVAQTGISEAMLQGFMDNRMPLSIFEASRVCECVEARLLRPTVEEPS